MSSIISPNLQKFTKQILSLVPYASNDRLEYLIQKLLPEETAGRQLAVKNEIKKLAQQSTKVIDLRSFFTDCETLQHNKVTHYLDSAGKELFNQKLLEYQNLYTMAVYYEVYGDAQARALAKEKSDSYSDNESSSESKFSEFKIDKTKPKLYLNLFRIYFERGFLNYQSIF